MKMNTSPLINPLAPLWSVYLSTIESNISPMINLCQYIEMNISIYQSPLIGLWKFLIMLHTYDFSNIYAFEYPPYGLSISPLWLYQNSNEINSSPMISLCKTYWNDISPKK